MRYIIGLFFILFLLFVPGAGRASSGGHPTLPPKAGQLTPEEAAAVRYSSMLVDFCNKNIVKYRNALAVLKTPPVVPVPPALPPECKQCGFKGPNETQAAVDQWFMQARKPEYQATQDLLSILRVMTMLGFDPSETATPVDTSALTPVAKSCMKQFDIDTIKESVNKLVTRQYKSKAIPMAQKYRKDPDRLRAGVPFVLSAAREYELQTGEDVAHGEGMQQAALWERSAFDAIEKTVFAKHEYYWCPSYMLMIGELERLGADKQIGNTLYDDPEANMRTMMRRLTDFMHFKVKMDVTMLENDGDKHTSIHWTGESQLAFDINYGTVCYTPKLRQDSLMMTVDNWMMRGKNGAVNLVGPHVFEAPVGGIKLNLCGQNPQIDIVFSNFGPPSQTDAPMTPPLPVFSGVMQSVLADDAKKSGRLQASAQNAKESLQSLKDQIAKHANDRTWLLSPEGQAVIAKISNFASGAASGAMQAGVSGAPTVEHISNELVMPWQNGTDNVADKSMTLDDSHGHFIVHLTIVHDPQNNSESGRR